MSEHDDSHPPSATERVQAVWHEIGQPLLDYLHARLGSRDEARDAAHETWVRLLAAVNTQEVLDLKGYAFGIARNYATDLLKKRWRDNQFNQEFTSEEQLRLNQEEQSSIDQLRCDQIDRKEIIEQALQELPIPVRDVAQAVLEGETPKAIATRLGVHLRMVYRHIDSAHEHFGQSRSAPQPRRTRR